MEGNLGYIFYHSLYKVENDKLIINTTEKKKLTDRRIKDNDIALFVSNKQENNISIYTTYPGFITGTGMTHGIKDEDDDFSIGSYFDHTAGIPVLTGSSVKGVLRSVFPTLKVKQNDGKYIFSYSDKQGGGTEINKVKAMWIYALLEELNKTNFNSTKFLNEHTNPIEIPKAENKEQEILEDIYKITMEIFEGVKDYKANTPKDKFLSIYNRDIFNDAFPKESFHTDKRFMGIDYITPHYRDHEKSYEENMLLNPIPLPFLKVLPNIAFQFNFDLKDSKVYPALEAAKKELLFKKILLTIGVGAKTNVGYGQFSLNSSNNNSLNNIDNDTDTTIEGDVYNEEIEDIVLETQKEYNAILISEKEGNIEFKISNKVFKYNLGSNEANKKQLYKFIEQDITIKIKSIFKDGNPQQIQITKLPELKNKNRRY